MHTNRFIKRLLLATAALAVTSCTVAKTPTPSLQGPSELGLSLTMSANPDTLSFDGASQSRITVEARDSNGQPARDVPIRVEIVANNTFVDFGSISARTIVTNANGQAVVIYTAPAPVAGPIPSLAILFTPTISCVPVSSPQCPPGNDAANQTGRAVTLRLVPPGTISAGAPTASFTVSPPSPAAFVNAIFDASASTPALGTTIASYAWSFGDGSSATGVQATHQFRSSGSFRTTLTVTGSDGLSASTFKDIQVGGGNAPSADFTFSPGSPQINQTVNFNGSLSVPGAGHSIVRYDWDFGSGSPQSGITVSKAYDTAGTYNVVLIVTDDVGQTAQMSHSVSVSGAGGASAPTASFTSSPTTPVINQPVNFNAGGSSTPSGTSITTYAWDFGDGSAAGSGVTPQHTYTVAATYVVRLTVTNSASQSGTTTGNVTVANSSSTVTADFSFSPTNPHEGNNVFFNASNSQPQAAIATYQWFWGDGTTDCGPAAGNADPGVTCGTTATGRTARTPNHTFPVAGGNRTWVVRLTVTDTSGRTATITKDVAVTFP